jgi:hypothetical protein
MTEMTEPLHGALGSIPSTTKDVVAKMYIIEACHCNHSVVPWC